MTIQTVAVLGAGIMGSQIAAHLANIGLDVDLLDISASQGYKNQVVEGAFQKACTLNPPILFTEETKQRIRFGNYEEHFDRLVSIDWVIEAVVENLAIKQELMQRLESVVNPDAIVSSNTSGLPIQAIAAPCSRAFRRRFLGTHFFNPPRYLKLLELIPSQDTDEAVLEEMRDFGRRQLGKGVVVAKDTPNFIANRIGMYVILQGIQQLAQGPYSIREIDAMTGVLMGRPKSATFRTADLVGLDTISRVAHHLYQAVPHDEQREIFVLPDLMKKLVDTGSFGAKSGQGFYKKSNGEILALNPEDLTYEKQHEMTLGNLNQLSHIPALSDRLQAIYQDPGNIGSFFRDTMLPLFSYCAHRIPEISDSPADLDQAMRWGFGWQMGPFEIWDALGFKRVVTDMMQRGLPVPGWVQTMGDQPSFYQSIQHQPMVASPTGLKSVPAKALDLAKIGSNPERVLWHNSESALLDLGDGVTIFEFRSKGNTLSLKVLEGLGNALEILVDHPDYVGLVIGNNDPHFSGGANLVEMGGMAQSDTLDEIQNLIVSFQDLLERIHTFPKPIVAAVQGRALGGGCELVMACPHVVAAAESYIGLVEMSVGLIPGAGGITRLVAEMTRRALSQQAVHIQPFILKAFETIAMAKVSRSAHEAVAFGYLTAKDQIVMDGDRRLEVAKDMVLRLAESGYIAPSRRATTMVLGEAGRAMMTLMANQMRSGHYISAYDHYLAGELAYVMTGGDLSAPAEVPLSYLLRLERERFVPLLSQPKTQARIAHVLKTKKPLRN